MSKSADSLLLGILITFLISVVIDKVMNGFSAGKMTMIIYLKNNCHELNVEKVQQD